MRTLVNLAMIVVSIVVVVIIDWAALIAPNDLVGAVFILAAVAATSFVLWYCWASASDAYDQRQIRRLSPKPLTDEESDDARRESEC